MGWNTQARQAELARNHRREPVEDLLDASMLSALTARGKLAHHANPPLLISREWRPSIQQSATKKPPPRGHRLFMAKKTELLLSD